MRWLIVAMIVLGVGFAGFLGFWPSKPGGSKPPEGFSPAVPGWLAGLVPDPPAARPRSDPPSQSLSDGRTWSALFFAEDGKLGVARFHLLTGRELKVTARAPGSKDQVLCITSPGVAAGCEDVGKDQRGNIVVRDRDARITLEATQGDVTFAIND